MIGGPFSKQELPAHLLTSDPVALNADEVGRLWELFDHIGRTWGARDDDPLYQRSQWLEFLQVRTEHAPSYVAEYRNAIQVLDELRRVEGDEMWQKLLFAHGTSGPPITRLGHLRVFVVEEFIQVWLTSGGFKSYGAGNYNSYISGSRFAVRAPYRRVPLDVQQPAPQMEPLDRKEV